MESVSEWDTVMRTNLSPVLSSCNLKRKENSVLMKRVKKRGIGGREEGKRKKEGRGEKGEKRMRRRGEGRGEEGRERGVLTSPFRTSFRVGYLLTRKGCEQRSPATNTDTQGSHTQAFDLRGSSGAVALTFSVTINLSQHHTILND